MKTPLIEIENLKWWYPSSSKFISDNFNFKLYENDFVVLLWKSGSWKTSLVKFLIRQLKPPKKSIFFKKEDLSRFSNSEVQRYRRNIWVIFQDFKLIDWKTVYENIAYNLEMRGEKKENIDKKVKEVLYKVWLFDKKDDKIPQLSWWEKQRVAIARALVCKPQFIIADEPTGNLDPQTAKQIVDLLIELNNQWNTVLFITHDMHLLTYLKSKKKNINVIEIWDLDKQEIETNKKIKI